MRDQYLPNTKFQKYINISTHFASFIFELDLNGYKKVGLNIFKKSYIAITWAGPRFFLQGTFI